MRKTLNAANYADAAPEHRRGDVNDLVISAPGRIRAASVWVGSASDAADGVRIAMRG